MNIRPRGLVAVGALVLLLVLMPSAKSLWIDEAMMVRLAQQPSLMELARTLAGWTQSEAQMPAAVAWFWMVEKIAGSGEWVLRASNLIWVTLAFAGLLDAGRRLRLPALPWVFLCLPFVWFYADEIRPYALQLAASAWMLAAMARLRDGGWKPGPLLLFLASAWLCAAASMLGVVAAGVAAVAAWRMANGGWRMEGDENLKPETGDLKPECAGTDGDRRIHRDDRCSPLFSALCFAPRLKSQVSSFRFQVSGLVLIAAFSLLATYYAWTLSRGVGGARMWEPGLGNLAFAAYELAGFSGWGPGREILREAARDGGVDAVVQACGPFAAGLTLLAAGWMAVGLLALSGIRRSWPHIGWCGGVALLTCAATVGLALAAGFPFWGRHLAPALPFALAAILGMADAGWRLGLKRGDDELRPPARPGWLKGSWSFLFNLSTSPPLDRAGVARAHVSGSRFTFSGLRFQLSGLSVPLLAVLLLTSSLQLRFAERHAKDDYRGAAEWALAEAAQGRVVWWLAHEPAAEYYGVWFKREGAGPGVYAIRGRDEALRAPAPDRIVLSKPEIFDRDGVVGALPAGGRVHELDRRVAFRLLGKSEGR